MAGQAVGRCVAGAADLALPGICAGCRADVVSESGLCTECNVRLLSLVSLPYCPRCGATIGPNLPVRAEGCPQCPDPLPRFRRVVRLGPYTGPLRAAVRELKYRRDETLLRRLGELLAEGLSGAGLQTAPDMVLPVAMHWRRRIARGTDHARALARAIARPLELPVGGELVRVRLTLPQVNLPRTRRIENVRGAFAARPAEAVAGANVLLVDDVTTTGATANAAARALLDAGAAAVALVVIAKAEPPRAYAEHWLG